MNHDAAADLFARVPLDVSPGTGAADKSSLRPLGAATVPSIAPLSGSDPNEPFTPFSPWYPVIDNAADRCRPRLWPLLVEIERVPHVPRSRPSKLLLQVRTQVVSTAQYF
ncbi:hypothetical protein K505DRAFT_326503, partial [Melanomma pulvis-pyrius CBS 109.77]